MVELRLDLLKEHPEKLFPLVDKDLKIITTCRPGYFSESERLEMLSNSIVLGADYIDIEIETRQKEIDALRELAAKNGCALIVSYHNFGMTPAAEELNEILSACFEKGADVAKIAAMANSQNDMVRLLSLYDRPGRKVIIGMGEMAGITRIAATILGAEFTFASVTEEDITAPGQLTINELSNVFKILNRS